MLEIGRDAAAGLHLADEQVSRRHARISPENDHALLEDLGSSNGTYVNDQPISGRQEVRRGDDIRAGLSVIRVRSLEELHRSPSAIGPAPNMTVIADVLQPVPREELSSVDIDVETMPSLLVEETEPAFVPRVIAEGDGTPITTSADPRYGALASLVDARVKHRTNVAALAFLSIAGLVVLTYFGAR